MLDAVDVVVLVVDVVDVVDVVEDAVEEEAVEEEDVVAVGEEEDAEETGRSALARIKSCGSSMSNSICFRRSCCFAFLGESSLLSTVYAKEEMLESPAHRVRGLYFFAARNPPPCRHETTVAPARQHWRLHQPQLAPPRRHPATAPRSVPSRIGRREGRVASGSLRTGGRAMEPCWRCFLGRGPG